MVQLGAVAVQKIGGKWTITTGQEINLAPEAGNMWMPDALAACRMTRDQTLAFPPAAEGMYKFLNYLNILKKEDRLTFVSDNNGFDWQFVNYYLHKYVRENPLGFSSMNLGSLYKGLVRDVTKNFKHLRKTKHTHNAFDDATGNAEALIEVLKKIKTP